MTTSIEYKGPSIHRRQISRKDLEAAGIDFPEGTTFPTMVWEPEPQRQKVRLPEDLPAEVVEEIVDVLKKDPTFTIKSEGEVVAKAAPNAGQTNADGSNAASGAGGSAALASTTQTVGGSTRTSTSR